MAISLQSLNTKINRKPPCVVLYGVEGIGKTTWAASAPNPVFICTEKGLDGIEDVPHWEPSGFDEVMETLGVLYTEEHDFQTLTIDSLDWLEPMIWAKVAADNEVPSVDKIGYGKGFNEAVGHWCDYLEGIDSLRADKGMNVIQIAHSMIKRFDSPETDPYDRYMIKLHEKASSKVREHATVVAFANYQVSIRNNEVGFNKKVSRAVGSGMRYLHLEERPAYQAKNKYGLPDKIEMKKENGWDELAQHIPSLNTQTATKAA